MSDLKASTLDEEAAACLTAARRALERGFAEGAAGIRDLPRTMEVHWEGMWAHLVLLAQGAALSSATTVHVLLPPAPCRL
jgi:hypothetical protein